MIKECLGWFLCMTCLLVGCGDSGNDDSTMGTQQPSTLQCCMAKKLCDKCLCDSNQTSIASSANEEACKTYLDQGDWGCSPTLESHYGESDALADCLGH